MKNLIYLIICLFAMTAKAQTSNLLFDVNPGSSGSFEFGLDQSMIIYQDKLYFGARSEENGLELWVYDGQTTSLFKDINEGPEDSDCDQFYILNDKFVFVANDGVHGDELWESDGTPEGTNMIVDLLEGEEGGVINCCNSDIGRYFIVFNDELYFNANIGNNRRRFYKSDGTAAGTVELAKLGGEQRFAEGLTVFKNELFFSVGFEGFWKTDGTTAGTVLIGDMDHEGGDLEPLYIYDMGDYMIMVNEYDWDLWRSDGTLEGTELIRDMVRPEAQNNQGLYFLNYNGVALFAGSNAPKNTELWRSDGTEQGTYEIIDVEDDSAFIPIYPRKKVIFNDIVYYIGGKDETGFQIYTTDGTMEGTKELVNLDAQNNGQVYFQSDLLATEKGVFFVAGRPFNRQLWFTDGTAEGTREVVVNPNGEATPERFFLFKNQLIFFANGDGVGWEPHYVDIDEIMVQTDETLEESSLHLYPNPASDFLYIENGISNNVRIYDISGNICLKSNTSENIAVSHLPAGIYTVEIIDDTNGRRYFDILYKVD